MCIPSHRDQSDHLTFDFQNLLFLFAHFSSFSFSFLEGMVVVVVVAMGVMEAMVAAMGVMEEEEGMVEGTARPGTPVLEAEVGHQGGGTLALGPVPPRGGLGSLILGHVLVPIPKRSVGLDQRSPNPSHPHPVGRNPNAHALNQSLGQGLGHVLVPQNTPVPGPGAVTTDQQ